MNCNSTYKGLRVVDLFRTLEINSVKLIKPGIVKTVTLSLTQTYPGTRMTPKSISVLLDSLEEGGKNLPG